MDNLLDKNIKLAVYIEDIIKNNHLIKNFNMVLLSQSYFFV